MTSSIWLSSSHPDQQPPALDTAGFDLHHSSTSSHQVSLTLPYFAHSSVPETPSLPFQKPAFSSFKSLQNVFTRRPHLHHSSSANSSQSALLAPSFESENISVHPYATMVPAPLPVVSNRDADEEEECPVCLEPLSFSFRLPGEKPHIVPECGHALHEVSLCSGSIY